MQEICEYFVNTLDLMQFSRKNFSCKFPCKNILRFNLSMKRITFSI